MNTNSQLDPTHMVREGKSVYVPNFEIINSEDIPQEVVDAIQAAFGSVFSRNEEQSFPEPTPEPAIEGSVVKLRILDLMIEHDLTGDIDCLLEAQEKLEEMINTLMVYTPAPRNHV